MFPSYWYFSLPLYDLYFPFGVSLFFLTDIGKGSLDHLFFVSDGHNFPTTFAFLS